MGQPRRIAHLELALEQLVLADRLRLALGLVFDASAGTRGFGAKRRPADAGIRVKSGPA
jgi:hypothetical protein